MSDCMCALSPIPVGGTNAEYRTETKARAIAMLPPIVYIDNTCCPAPASKFRMPPAEDIWKATQITSCPTRTLNTNIGGALCTRGNGMPSATVIHRILPQTSRVGEYARPMRGSASSLLTHRIQADAIARGPNSAVHLRKPRIPECAPMRQSRAMIPKAPNPCYSTGQRTVDYSSPYK